MADHYEIDYTECEYGVYWHLFRNDVKINGGIRDSQREAAQEASHRMRYDRSVQWSIQKGYARAK